MTGIESVAAGLTMKAADEAVKAGKNAGQTKREVRKLEQQALVEAAKETPGFKQAAEIRGRKIALKEQWGLALMKPLSGVMGISREYFESDFSKDFGEKLVDVPEENLQTPKASIAGPAMEGLGYSLEEPELKNMYLELLARAADDRVSTTAHPSFVQTIRQLTAEEAAYLPILLKSPTHPTAIVQYRAQFIPEDAGHGYNLIRSHVLNLTNNGALFDNPMLPTYVDNWVRLKLVEVAYDVNLTDPLAYEWEKFRPEREAAQKQVDEMLSTEVVADFASRGVSGLELVAQRGVLSATSLGYQFAVASGIVEANPRV